MFAVTKSQQPHGTFPHPLRGAQQSSGSLSIPSYRPRAGAFASLNAQCDQFRLSRCYLLAAASPRLGEPTRSQSTRVYLFPRGSRRCARVEGTDRRRGEADRRRFRKVAGTGCEVEVARFKRYTAESCSTHHKRTHRRPTRSGRTTVARSTGASETATC